MRDPFTPPDKAYLTDANRPDPEVSAHAPEGLVRWLALLICFLMEPWNVVRLYRCSRPQFWWPDRRPDLPAGSAQAEAASIRGAFGNAIAWMCRRHGIGPGHRDWPELSRAIVAFGGSMKRFDFSAPAWGLQWWENPNVVPGTIGLTAAPPAATATASLLARQAVANPLPPAPGFTQAEAMPPAAAHARSPASWVSATGRQVFARAGPGPSTGPPRCLGLPNLSSLMHGAGARLAPPY
jgi:hypothetical protein